MACPKPHPGHQLKPISFKGHKVKWLLLPGSDKPSATIAIVQNISSKLFLTSLINFFGIGHQY